VGHDAGVRAAAMAAAALTAAGAAGAALGQCAQQRLMPMPEKSFSFGTRMAMDGDHLFVQDGSAFVSCGTRDPFECGGGALFAYRHDGDQWVFTQMITRPAPRVKDGFGNPKFDNGRLLVGLPENLISGRLGRVFEYAFDDEAERWVEVDSFGPPPTMPEGGFSLMAFEGDLALMLHGGQTLRYLRTPSGWEFGGVLDLAHTAAGVEATVKHLTEDWAIFATAADSRFGDRHGSAWVYRRNPDNTFTFVQELLPPDLAMAYEPVLGFGVRVGFDGRTLAISSIGASREFDRQGVVFVYELEGGTWTLRQELTHSDAGVFQPPIDSFGSGLAVDGDTLIAGTADQGNKLAYVFERSPDGVWSERVVLRQDVLDGVSPLVRSLYGQTIAIDGDRVVIGAPRDETPMPRGALDETGAAYAYDLSQPLDCDPCPGDVVPDGIMTFLDFTNFQRLFDAGHERADLDGDGELTLYDWLAFQTAFDAGCP